MSFCCEGVLGYGVNTHEEEPTTVLPPTNSDALFASLFVKHGDLPHTLFDELLSVFRYLDFSSKDVTLTIESTADEENYSLVEDWGQSTISDALLAWLLESNGSYQPISFSRNLLSLLQHHEFDSDDVTMKNTEVILDHIEGRLRLVAFEKKIDHLVQSGDRIDNPVPTLVVELVAEELESQRRPFQSILRTSLLFSEADKTFRDMCLVHSSWTSAARPPFRRRICVDEKGLRSLLRSPHLGPWVRELAYRPCLSLRSDYDGISSHLQLEEPCRLLCRIVKRCPNITQLHLQDLYPYTEATTDDNPIAEGFFPPLRDMQYLTHLWLHSPYEGYSINLWDLCMVLPQLQSLKTLNLECVGARYTVRGRYDASKLIEESSPSPTLKSLSLMHMYTYDKGPLKWLTHPRAGYTLNKLEVKYFVGSSLNYNHKFKKQLNYLSPASHPHIEELRVIDFRGESDFASAIETLTSLRILSLCMHRFKSLPADHPLELPASVRDLHIRLLGDPMDSKHASAIRALLVASPHLRRLSLTFTLIVREPLDGQKPVVRTLDAAEIQTAFTSVIQHCSENNICFVSDVEEPIHDYFNSDL